MTHIFEVLAQGIGTTLAITALAFLLGMTLALPLALARESRFRLLRWPVAAYLDIVRGIPPITWLFIVFFGLGDGVVTLSAFHASWIALGVIASAYLAEIFRAGIRSVSRGQRDAGHAIGLSPLESFRRVIGPQAAIIALPPAATYLVGLLKESALASTLGAQDITFHAFYETQKNLDGLRVFLIAGLFYIVLSLPIAAAARWLGARWSSSLRVA